MNENNLGGSFKLAPDMTVNRMGYGAMQLAGPGVFGPPKDKDEAIAVLREVINQGINHIDTSDFYGPYVTNKLIKEALHPYPEGLHIVTKVGARRDDTGAWLRADSAEELKQAIQDNLEHLGLDVIDVVNYRAMGGGEDGHTTSDDPIGEEISVLNDLKKEGLIKHIGLSNVSMIQVEEAQKITDIVCVQNLYNIVKRKDDELIKSLNEQGIAYVPFFPLGGFNPIQSEFLDDIAKNLETSPMTVALAWLHHKSPNILLIPGTSSVDHLKQNISAASLELSPEVLAQLDSLADK
jgi:pyridoxine 4-dehydrogenase